jgi:uncharacterized protein
MAEQRHILFYEYVEDILERREPFRAEHLGAIRTGKEDGRILQAGPLGDPPHGGALVFTDASDAEAFAQADPYVINGLVTGWRVELWTLV